MHVGRVADRKGEKPVKWQLRVVGGWIVAEMLGFMIGILMFGTDNLIGLMLFGLISAVGGYLFVKAQLDKIPDRMDDDINRIGK